MASHPKVNYFALPRVFLLAIQFLALFTVHTCSWHHQSLHVLCINCIITYHSRSFLILTSSRSLSPIFCFENASSIFHAALSEYWHKKTCFLICILLKITLRLFSSFELWCCRFVHQLTTFPCVWLWPGRRLAYKGWPVRTCALSLYYSIMHDQCLFFVSNWTKLVMMLKLLINRIL